MLSAPAKTQRCRSRLSASAILSLLLAMLTLSGGLCTSPTVMRMRRHYDALHRRILRSVPAERYQVMHRSYHGETWTVRLKDDVVLQGIPCRKGTVELSGRVVLATLSRPHRIGSTLLAAGTVVRWCRRRVQGKLRAYLCEVALSRDTMFSGTACEAGARVFFDDSGQVVRCSGTRK